MLLLIQLFYHQYMNSFHIIVHNSYIIYIRHLSYNQYTKIAGLYTNFGSDPSGSHP